MQALNTELRQLMGVYSESK